MPWALRITAPHATGTDVGAGMALSPDLVLTCEHVVQRATGVAVRSPSGDQFAFKVAESDPELDVALLVPDEHETGRIAEPWIAVPRRLWRGSWPTAPAGPGSAVWAESTTAEAHTPRRMEILIESGHQSERSVQFVVQSDRQGARHGHSGGPALESEGPARSPRAFGIVRAIDRHATDERGNSGAGWLVPMDRIAERFEAVAKLTETPVERLAAWREHWEPRSRGVVSAAERGFYYSGHRTAYDRVLGHLANPAAGLLVVTASRARGKSALLARITALSCPRYLSTLGDQADTARDGYRSLDGPVDAAVLTRGKSPDAVAAEIATQLGLGPCTPDDLVAALFELAWSPVVVLDAVDESPAPRDVIRLIAVPLADAGARVAIGVHSRLASAVPAGRAAWVDLDRQYRDDAAVPGYITARLSRGGLYTDETARAIADVLATRANGNFLYAELAGRTLATTEPIDIGRTRWWDQLPDGLHDAFSDYLERFGAERTRMLALLQPLAHALGDGLPIEPGTAWLAAANRLRPDTLAELTTDDLRDVVGRAADYLVVQGESGARRLFHEGMRDAVRAVVAREAVADAGGDPQDQAALQSAQARAEARFADSLTELLPPDPDVRAKGYRDLDPYLLEHLVTHLAERGRLGEVLRRPGLLLAAHQDALRRALIHGASTIETHDEAARVAAVHALSKPTEDTVRRATLLVAALRRQGDVALADRVRAAVPVDWLPHELISGPPLSPVLATIDGAHDDRVNAIAVLETDQGPLIFSGGDDGALRSWHLDGQLGPLQLPDAGGPVTALAALNTDRGPLVVSGGGDGAIRSWRLDGQLGSLQVAPDASGPIRALVVLRTDGMPLVVSGGDNGSLRTWQPDGHPGPLQVPDDHIGAIRAIAILDTDRPLVLTVGSDRTLRSWRLDRKPGPIDAVDAHIEAVDAVAVLDTPKGAMIFTAGEDGLRTWRPDGRAGPAEISEWEAGQIKALVPASDGNTPLMISAGIDGTLRSWRRNGKPGKVEIPNAHGDDITALAVLQSEQGPLIVSAGKDRAVRTWRPSVNARPKNVGNAHTAPIRALAVLPGDSQPLILSGGDDRALRSWWPDGNRGPVQVSDSRHYSIRALTTIDAPSGRFILSAGTDGRLRSWRLDGQPGPIEIACSSNSIYATLALADSSDPVILTGQSTGLCSWDTDGRPQAFDVDAGSIRALAVVKSGDQPLILTGNQQGELLSWWLDGRPSPLGIPSAHSDWITALTVVKDERGSLIVSAGADGALRSWRLDGQPGPLSIPDAHATSINALAVARSKKGTLLFSAGVDRALRSWRLDGTPGPIQVPDMHSGTITALASLVDRHGRRLIISAGSDRSILATRVPGGLLRQAAN